MNKEYVLKKVKDENIKFIRLQITDINGMLKNVEIPSDELSHSIEKGTMFDGSSIEGMVRIDESDMFLKPDLNSFSILPWTVEKGKVARLMCDVYKPNGEPFHGDPRFVLRKVINNLKEEGLEGKVGPEPEFFLLPKDENTNKPKLEFLDNGGYFDLLPIDKGEETRKYIVENLEEMGINVEASHHEVAPSQHEIDFTYDNLLNTADNIQTFKNVVKTIAIIKGIRATFMPKPFQNENGSGMHCHLSLFNSNEENIFYDENSEYKISKYLKYFIGGIFQHINSITAIANPTVNSYKRLVSGYEAPTNIAWSVSNRSALIRIPAPKELNTRIELRSPDPTSNPYLLLAVLFASGLKGIKEKIVPPDPIIDNIYTMSDTSKIKNKIKNLPSNLLESVDHLKKDTFIKNVLGDHIYEIFIETKTREYKSFTHSVTDWEINRYLGVM